MSHLSLSDLQSNPIHQNYSVSTYLEKTRLKPFIVINIIVLGTLFGASPLMIYISSINTFIPTRTCTNGDQTLIINNDNISMQNMQCKDILTDENWTCVDEITQPQNLTTRFGLECDPEMRPKFAQIGLLQNLAMLVGSSIVGQIINNIGRKRTILFGGVLVLSALIGVYQSTGQWTFLIQQTLVGFFGEFIHIPGIVLATELVSRNRNALVTTIMNSLDNANCIISVIFQWWVQDMWVVMVQLIVRIVIIQLFIFLITPESPYQFQLVRNFKRCNEELQQMFKNCNIESMPMVDMGDDENDRSEHLAKTKLTFNLVFSIIQFGCMWLCNILMLFFMFQYAKQFPLNVYLTLGLESIACMIGCWLSQIGLNIIGKKRSIIICYSLIAMLSLFYKYYEQYSILLQFTIMLNLVLTNASLNILQTMPPSLFQDDIIGVVYGVVSAFGRIGGTLAPILAEFAEPNIVLLIFSILGLFCAIFIRNQKYLDDNQLNMLKENEIPIPKLALKRRNDTIENLVKEKKFNKRYNDQDNKKEGHLGTILED